MPLAAATACEIDGASDASKIAQNAIHTVIRCIDLVILITNFMPKVKVTIVTVQRLREYYRQGALELIAHVRRSNHISKMSYWYSKNVLAINVLHVHGET